MPVAIAQKGIAFVLAILFGATFFNPFRPPDINATIFNHHDNKFYGEIVVDGKRMPIVVAVEGKKPGSVPNKKETPERLRITYKQNEKGGIAEITVEREGNIDDPLVREIINEIKKYANQAKNRESISGRCRNFINSIKVWK